MFLDGTIKSLLQDAKKIAIIGAKDKDGQPVNMVGRYLISMGFSIYPVHPKRENVWGLPTYKNINSLPEPVDIINVFRASAHCLGHAQEVLQLPWQPACFWMQSGISSSEAGQLLAPQGIKIIENLCIKTEHERLL